MSKWQPAKQLIESWQPLSHALWQQFRNLVQRSDAHLKPLADPFHHDLRASRLFSDAREETYSDWLAWILRELASCPDGTARIFQLLHISEKEFQEVPEIFRELPIDQGHEGHRGRLDILVIYKERKLLIHIEVKVREAEGEGADIKKNVGYMKALQGKYRYIPNQQHVLLVTDAPNSIYDGFTILKWSHVSKVLRQLAADQSTCNENPLLSAMMLLFAGVVEQTLYKFPCLPKDKIDCPLHIPSQHAITYLTGSFSEREREGESMMPNNEKEIENSRQQFMEVGIQYYVKTLSVIQEFNDELCRRSEEVVKKRVLDLGCALGRNLQPHDIKKYLNNVTKTDNCDPSDAWVASIISMATPFLKCYFGIRWSCGIPCVAVMMDPGNAIWRDFIIGKIDERSISGKVDVVYGNEVAISKEIEANGFKDFEEKLNQLISDWVKVWKKIGGIEGLNRGGPGNSDSVVSGSLA
jgi:hypothetical protein